MQIDEISYLDQLHDTATGKDGSELGPGTAAKAKFFGAGPLRGQHQFFDLVFKLWPEISTAFDEHKHSL